ncbi:MAG: hypothetical protein ACQER9_03605 [Nanobdellota archaeon]
MEYLDTLVNKGFKNSIFRKNSIIDSFTDKGPSPSIILIGGSFRKIGYQVRDKLMNLMGFRNSYIYAETFGIVQALGLFSPNDKDLNLCAVETHVYNDRSMNRQNWEQLQKYANNMAIEFRKGLQSNDDVLSIIRDIPPNRRDGEYKLLQYSIDNNKLVRKHIGLSFPEISSDGFTPGKSLFFPVSYFNYFDGREEQLKKFD